MLQRNPRNKDKQQIKTLAEYYNNPLKHSKLWEIYNFRHSKI